MTRLILRVKIRGVSVGALDWSDRRTGQRLQAAILETPTPLNGRGASPHGEVGSPHQAGASALKQRRLLAQVRELQARPRSSGRSVQR